MSRFDVPFTDTEIDSLTIQSQRALIKLGSKIGMWRGYSFDWCAIPLMNVLLHMESPLTINGILQKKPVGPSDGEYHVVAPEEWTFAVRGPRTQKGSAILKYYFIPLFVECGLLRENHQGRFTTYMATQELKEIVRLWLEDDICKVSWSELQNDL